ncbi:hypothetical protein DFX34_RS13060 [Vibrio parahaemolyticus]|uniref:hypothetical protein n=1 Tax=Vibrio parahaemolyticus TaxID=670 RepID=UPI001112CCD7|nr:hypothetical protein [Vibrio parahaemolyticus]EJF4093389.1 hypothetical protein [Vibrio parahaemolyticus]EJG0302471.1 hypothetical protein [Vibrio parahaemolyticus]EJG0514835.1 hypothetical protein [Vibrio parahaemolyticus]
MHHTLNQLIPLEILDKCDLSLDVFSESFLEDATDICMFHLIQAHPNALCNSSINRDDVLNFVRDHFSA